ncbi:MAG: transporter [Clostridia bacterium]|nr:transporter [Clostridia bacterium]NCC44302.1 transporter [Clostridia bacterium]
MNPNNENKEIKKNRKAGSFLGLFIVLQLCLLLSSLSGVCSKMAANQKFLSFHFCLYFGLVLAIMVVYAVVWQQVLKRMPLTVAYANRPITLIWGIIWGALIFKERITWNMILGAGIIFLGIYLVVSADE